MSEAGQREFGRADPAPWAVGLFQHGYPKTRSSRLNGRCQTVRTRTDDDHIGPGYHWRWKIASGHYTLPATVSRSVASELINCFHGVTASVSVVACP